MAIDNYQDLKGAVADWLARQDIPDRIVDFISIAEDDIGRRLKAVAMETIATTPLVEDQVYYALPPRMTELRNVYVNPAPVTKLVYLTPEQLITEYPDTTSEVVAYTIVDGQFKLNASGNSNQSLAVSFYRQFDDLSDENNTNWLTENASDLLLYGALSAAEMFVVNDSRMPMWKQEFVERIQVVNQREDRKRHTGSVLRVRHG